MKNISNLFLGFILGSVMLFGGLPVQADLMPYPSLGPAKPEPILEQEQHYRVILLGAGMVVGVIIVISVLALKDVKKTTNEHRQ